jgi:hypothetical protein
MKTIRLFVLILLSVLSTYTSNAQIIVGQPEAKKVLYRGYDNVLQISSAEGGELEIQSDGMTLTKSGNSTYIARVSGNVETAWLMVYSGYHGDTIAFEVKSIPSPMLKAWNIERLRTDTDYNVDYTLSVLYPEELMLEVSRYFTVNSWTAKCSCSNKEFSGVGNMLSKGLIDQLRSPKVQGEITLTIECEYEQDGVLKKTASAFSL